MISGWGSPGVNWAHNLSLYATGIPIMKLALTTAMILLTSVVVGQADPMAYVINASGETLSKINLATGDVTNNILTIGSDVGSQPNQIVVRDSLAYIVASGTAEIQVVDLNSETTVDYISTGPGSNPFWMAFLDSQYVFVSLLTERALALYDIYSGVEVDRWIVGDSPEGVLLANGKAYVAVTAFNQATFDYGQGMLVAIDVTAGEIADSILTGMNPQYLARDSRGFIHVVCTGDYWSTFGMIYVIDPNQAAVVDSLAIGGSPGMLTIGPDDIAYSAAGGWIDDGYVYAYDAISATPLHNAADPLVVDSGCMMVSSFQDSSCFVGSFKDFVKPIDSSGETLRSFAVGDGPVHIGFRYLPGDINGDFIGPDIADLIHLVTYMFQQGAVPAWPRWRANVNGDNIGPDIADLVYLVSYMFQSGPSPKVAPAWPNY